MTNKGCLITPDNPGIHFLSQKYLTTNFDEKYVLDNKSKISCPIWRLKKVMNAPGHLLLLNFGVSQTTKHFCAPHTHESQI